MTVATTECRGHCGDPIISVTLAGISVWAHDRPEPNPSVYNYANHGPRMCGRGDGTMAAPKNQEEV